MLSVVTGDIVNQSVDIVVNAANRSLLGGGGVDGAIHRAAGPGLLAECKQLGGCATGSAKITRGHQLKARYIIHTVGPVWQDGTHGESDQLRSCYDTALALALDLKGTSIAFPAISTGVYGFPIAPAAAIAVERCRDFLQRHDMDIYLVCFDQTTASAIQALVN
jgi:O-acetyl-ADP-ribose deacetylase